MSWRKPPFSLSDWDYMPFRAAALQKRRKELGADKSRPDAMGRNRMRDPKPLSDFVGQMQELLHLITHAGSDVEREQAEEAMAKLIRQHAGGARAREPFDPRAAQLPTGDQE